MTTGTVLHQKHITFNYGEFLKLFQVAISEQKCQVQFLDGIRS